MPSYEKKESFEQKRKRLASVKVWIKNFMDADEKNKTILETFEKNAELEIREANDTNDTNPNAEPINILVIEGGGMKGYAAVATVEAIQDHYLEKDQDFFGQFDLIAGTSVGGMSALLVSHYWSLGCTTDEVISKGRDVMDEIRDHGFSKINFWNLLCCNQLIEKKSQIIYFLQKYFDVPLKNPYCIPTMVCIAAVKESKERDEETLKQIDDREIEPLIGRTYEYPNAQFDEDIPKLAHSSSSMKMYEAMAATGSPPVLVDRVRAKVDGKMRIMADGGLFQNCPLALAIDEVSRLYPGRPIGVIVDLGYTDNEELFVHRTLETARIKYPNMHFQRFAANDIMKDFSAIETDIHTIAEMEQNVKDYVINTQKVRNSTVETMKRLFASEPRSFSNPEKDDHDCATAGTIMDVLGKSVAFQQRQRMRASVAHSHLHPQSRFEFAKSILGLKTFQEYEGMPQTIHSTEGEEQSSLDGYSAKDHKNAEVSFEAVENTCDINNEEQNLEEQEEAEKINFESSCCKAQEARLQKIEESQKALELSVQNLTKAQAKSEAVYRTEIAALKKEVVSVGGKRSQSRANKRRLENYLKRQMSPPTTQFQSRSSSITNNTSEEQKTTRLSFAEDFTHGFESDEISTDEQFTEDFLAQ